MLTLLSVCSMTEQVCSRVAWPSSGQKDKTFKSYRFKKKKKKKKKGKKVRLRRLENSYFLPHLQEMEEFSFVTQLAGVTDHLSVAMRLAVATGEEEP